MNNPTEIIVGFKSNRIDFIEPIQQTIIDSFRGVFVFFVWLAILMFGLSAAIGKFMIIEEFVLTLQMLLLFGVYVGV